MAAEIPGAEMFVVDKATHQSLLCQRVMWDTVQEFLEKKLGVMANWKRLVKITTAPESGLDCLSESNESFRPSIGIS